MIRAWIAEGGAVREAEPEAAVRRAAAGECGAWIDLECVEEAHHIAENVEECVLFYRRWTVVVVLVYLYFPFGALTLYSSIDRFDWDQLHAAMDLGASPLRAIQKILIPQIRPGIVAAVIFVFIPILGEYLAPQIVGGTDGVMMGNLIDEFQKEALYARAASISLLIAAFIVLLLVLFRKSLSAREAYGA